MPDSRRHRGSAPEDERLFAPAMLPRLRQATSDLSWLLSRGYASRSSLALVGDRYGLTARQRMAVARCACSDEAAIQRRRRRVDVSQLAGQELWLDGLNVLTGLEVALSGGVILLARDGCCRDIAGLHRHYRKVEETSPAIQIIGELTHAWAVKKCRWWLDRPVSNTGRLKTLILDLAGRSAWDWEVDLVYNPDSVLSKTEHVVATSDSVILDRCQGWLNLVRLAILARIENARLYDFAASAPDREMPKPSSTSS